MVLTLQVDGASPETLARGIAAAQAVLNEARVTAAEAAMAHWAREEWRRSKLKDASPPMGILEAAAAFALAEAAAIATCCADCRVPEGSRLGVESR